MGRPVRQPGRRDPPRGSIWFDTRAEAHAYLFVSIEVCYNRQRHQTDLGHLTPAESADKRRRNRGEPNHASHRVQDSESRPDCHGLFVR